MNRNWRTWIFTGLVSVIGGLLPAAFSPAKAQDIVPYANRGVPEDWSHRHVVNRSPETMKEAAGKGTVHFQRWQEKMKDPRFVKAVAKRTVDEQPTANKVFSGKQLASARRLDRTPKLSSLTRDWSVPLGSDTTGLTGTNGTGVGTQGMFPAKYTWDINATPSCTNDFLVYSTMTPGATTGTSARQIGTFTSFDATTFAAVQTGNATLTISNGINSIVLRASVTISLTSNTGLNFYMGATRFSGSPPYYAENLAAAINRNGHAVGVSATSLGGVVTIIANAAGTAGNNITLTKSAQLPDALLDLGGSTGTNPANLAGGAASATQPTLVAYNNLYKGLCGVNNDTFKPNIFWSVNTGTGSTVETSPVLSLDGTQVAFVQRTSAPTATTTSQLSPGQNASLVLLKWASGAATGVPTPVTAANYRSCTAPCMTVFSLGANNQNSSPYVDYANDVIYVGDAVGKLHKFTNVFNGTPAEVVSSPWPVTVSAGNMLSSPVYDSASNRVFVGSDVSEVVSNPAPPAPQPAYTGGMLHAVNATTGAVVDSSQFAGQVGTGAGSRGKQSGVRDGAILDSTAQRVYAFTESDTSGDCLDGTTAGNCKAVVQFPTNFGAGATGTKRQIGRGFIAGRTLYVGQFDDAYWSSIDPTNPSGNLYVCGSGANGANSRAPTLWRIPIVNNAFGTAAAVMTVTTLPAQGEVGASCSPITTLKNGANEYLYMGVTANGNITGICTGACLYMFQLNAPRYDTTTTPAAAVPGNVRYMSVSTPTALNTTIGNVATTIVASVTYTSMNITQTVANPSGGGNARTIVYTLLKNGVATDITCTTAAGALACTDPGSATFAPGDTIAVSVDRSDNDSSAAMQIRVQLNGPVSTRPVAGLQAPGGTSGIVVDNISTAAGASQVYYSTLQRPGNAIQASQAGLQ